MRLNRFGECVLDGDPGRPAPQLVRHRASRGDRVELIRVVERRGFGGARRARVVVARDRVQQLRAHIGLERGCARLHESQPEMHVS